MALKKYGWLTDTHFDFLSKSEFLKYVSHLESQNLDGIFLTGDVSTGQEVSFHLKTLSRILRKPIYFVLGNHDFYRSTFKNISDEVTYLAETDPNLHFMSASPEPLYLNDKVAVIGHDGWYDARFRNPLTTLVFAMDFLFINDFKFKNSNADRIRLVRELADKSAKHVEYQLYKAIETHDIIYLLTHVPPWPRLTHRFFGLADAFWMPYNSSMIMADTIISIMKYHPNKKLIILSGHTHLGRTEKISNNIELRVGDASLRRTELQDVIFIPG